MLKDEFRLKSIKLSYKPTNDFVESKWFPTPVLIVYRGIFAVVCLTWIIYDVATSPSDNKTLFYLTNWTYYTITAYFILSTVITSLHYAQGKNQQHIPLVKQPEFLDENERKTDEANDDDSMKWYHQVLWLLYNISANMSICVTMTFWAIIYDGKGINTSDIFVHILNSIFMVSETVLSSMPLRILHFVYPFIFALLYTLSTVLFWLFIDKSPIYPVLDYTHNPGLAIGILAFSHFITLPIVQLFLYILYRFRKYLSTKYVETLD